MLLFVRDGNDTCTEHSLAWLLRNVWREIGVRVVRIPRAFSF